MDGFIGELGNRLKVSIPDSTMMSIVNHAMDKAHAKVKSDGVIGRLNEISRFYELAVIQLEGCMRLVQEEGDDRSHRDLLYDLGQVRDHLLGRLEEAEIAICQKDREMMEIWDTVLKLRQALELREGELEALRGRIKSGEDGEFHDLKNSVDQQVWSMRHNYAERSRRINCMEMDSNGVETDMIISNLKETFDMAFGKMQCAISSWEVGPVEQQWKWSVETDVTALLIKGFIKDIEKDHNQSEGLDTVILSDPKSLLYQFSDSLLKFQEWLHDSLLRSNLRLSDIKCQLDVLTEQTHSLKKKEFLYKKAFVRRCQNLKRAETEVLKKRKKLLSPSLPSKIAYFSECRRRWICWEITWIDFLDCSRRYTLHSTVIHPTRRSHTFWSPSRGNCM